MKAVAYATWEGRPVYLKPAPSLRKGRMRTMWQWQTDDGVGIGSPHTKAQALIRHALRNPDFSYVSCDIGLSRGQVFRFE